MRRIANAELILGLALAAALFFSLLLGKTGFLVIVFSFVLFMVPSYILLERSKLGFGEKLMFSFVIGMLVYPSLVYVIGLLIGSLSVSIYVSFLLWLGVALYVFLRK